MAKTKKIKAYKVFNPDFTCRGFQFAVGETYRHEGRVKACRSGFHACLNLADCFSYYQFDQANKVAEVELWGATKVCEEDSKIVAEYIKIVRELEWSEVPALANSGSHNAGYGNSGNWNSGNRNSGNWNSGNRNSGDQNSGYRNSGAFCTDDNPTIFLFDKPTNIKVREWENSKAVSLMWSNLETAIWVSPSEMTDKEKEDHPHWKTTGGYLKSIPLKYAWRNAWHTFPDESKLVFLRLPNFDLEKFQAITGIDASDDHQRLVK